MLALAPAAVSVAQQPSAPVLEEIVVTAQKREESIQQVSIAMAVLDSQELERHHLLDLPDAARVISNVEMFEDYSGSGAPTWVIRGVGLQDFSTNNTPTAAVYVDEVYQTSTVMGGAPLFDVRQLEVLKGPQGGIYGRNTSGGAVLLNTRRAVLEERSGYMELSYGRWQQVRAEGAANIPLQPSLALRLAGRVQRSNDAWQRVLPTGQSHGEIERSDVRAWLLFEPDQDLQLEWKIQAGEDNSEIVLGHAVGLYNARGSFCEPILQGRRDPESCLSWGALHDYLAERRPFEREQAPFDASLSASDPLNQQDNRYLSNALYITKTLGMAELVSVTSLDRFNYGVQLDLDGTRGEYAHRVSSSDINVLAQEVRLVSRNTSTLQWLLGLSLSREKFVEERDFEFRDNVLVSRSIGFRYGRLEFDQDTSSQAAYGRLAYDLDPQWRVNASLRYTREEKHYRNGDLYVPGESPFYLIRGLNRDYDLDSHISGRLGLDWSPRENLLLYAYLARGFKSGGFYGGFPSSPEEVNAYEEETILAYEVGFKSGWPERELRINGAVFYYDYQDVQAFVSRQSALTETLIDVLANPADARHQGAEVEVHWRMTPALTTSLNLGYLSAEFVNGIATRNILRDQVIIEGRRPFAPRWSGSFSAQYEMALGRKYRGVGSLSYHYRSEFSGHLSTLAEQALFTLPGYGLWNARFDITSISNSWTVSLWADNLLDKRYLSRTKSDGLRGYLDLYGQPRRVGASIKYQW